MTSNESLRRSPKAILREAQDARNEAIADGFRWLWRALTKKSPPSPRHHFVKNAAAAHN